MSGDREPAALGRDLGLTQGTPGHKGVRGRDAGAGGEGCSEDVIVVGIGCEERLGALLQGGTEISVSACRDVESCTAARGMLELVREEGM